MWSFVVKMLTARSPCGFEFSVELLLRMLGDEEVRDKPGFVSNLETERSPMHPLLFGLDFPYAIS